MSTRKFLIFYFIIMTLAIYNVPIGPLNFSLDRLLILFALLAVLVNKRTIVPGLAAVIIWLVVASVLSIAFAKDYDFSGFMLFAPSWFQSILVFYLATASANKFGYDFIDKVFKGQFYILLPLTLYGFWYVYIQDTIDFTYPLDFLLRDLNADEHKLNMLRYKRLFFPLSSAPRLGFVAGTLFIYSLYFMKNRRWRFWYCTATLFILMVTISRGPMVSLVLSFVLAYLVKGIVRRKMMNQVVFYSLVLILAGFVVVNVQAYLGEESPFSRIFLLGSEEDASFQGHLNIRIKVLEEVFNDTLNTMFFGKGLGQFSAILRTSSAHSSYFTQLYEQGLFGVLAYIMVFFTTVGASGRLYLKFPSRATMGLFIMAIFLGVIHLTYDAITTTILWAYTGFVFGVSYYLKRYYEA